jgi:hypothetical protein
LGDNYSYAATDANYKSGEIVQVSAFTSSIVLALVGKIYGSMAPGNAYTVANTSIIRRISPIIAPGVQGIQFLGDKSNTSTAMQFSYALNSNISVGVQNYGNTGLLVRGCIGGEAGGCSFDDLTDDVANGHAGYGVCIAGPSMSFRVHDFLASRCRHGITTIGGVTGYPHELLVSDAIARDTSQAGFDCHNAVDGMTLNDCWSIRSGGAGASIRGRNVTLRNFRAQKPASHGVYLAEDGVSNVTLSKFEIEDPGGHGIASSVSCTNLRLTGGDIYRAALDGVHLFDTGIYDSTGLVMRQVNVLGYGLGTTGANGIVTTGSFTTTGAVIEGCLVAPLTGSAAYGIRTLALTGSAVIDNKAMGTFSAASFSLGANIDLGNKRIDGSVPQVRLDSTTSAVRATGPSTNHDLLLLPQGTGGVVRFGTFASEADAPIVGSVSIKTADGVTHKLATIS